jgi:hypothetical protein
MVSALSDDLVMADILDRLNRQTDRSGGSDSCWPFTGHTNEKGYGVLYLRKRPTELTAYAHRAAFILHTGSTPDGGCVLHKCDNPPCCNPVHLRAGTQLDNLDDMRVKGRGAVPDGKGENNGRATIAETDALEIARLYRSGLSPKEVMSETGHGYGIVSNIMRGVAWSYLTGIPYNSPIVTSRVKRRTILTSDEKQALVRRRHAEGLSYKQLGEAFGVNACTAHRIVTKQR